MLPPLELPDLPATETSKREGEGPLIVVAGLRVTGNTILARDELESVLMPYVQQPLTFDQLQRLQDELTFLYIRRGYVTSGAQLAQLPAADGFVEFQMTEGVLRDVRIEGERSFREKALRSRSRLQTGSIVNVETLEQQLRALQDDPRIDRIDARLVPTQERGQADLELTVRERSPLRFSIEFDNQQSPGVGSEAGRLDLTHLNLTGSGDTLRASFGRSDGLSQFETAYEHPIGPHGTSIRYRFQKSRSRVIEAPFDDLGIRSRSTSYGIDIRQPLRVADPGRQFDLVLGAEYRRSKEFFLGSGFSFSESSDRGMTRLALLTFAQEASFRSAEQVVAARSAFRWGLGALGATTRGSRADGRFVSWLGQVQLVRRLTNSGMTVVLRGDLQLSNDPLPGIEQFGIGGQATVRGYRENRIVRDNGFVASAELRVPVLRRPNEEPRLQLVPFLDLGQSWNRERETPSVRTLSSVGLGFRVRLSAHLSAELYYAHGFRDLPDAARSDALQDRGLHFRIRAFF